MSLATLDGITVLRCRVQLPAWGVWYADVEIDQPTVLSGSVSLVVGDLTLSGTVVSGGAWHGRARYTVAAGAGRWGEEIVSRHYVADNGVKASKVLVDAADACGETIANAPSTVIGTAWTREQGPASLALELLYPRGWYVDESGVTRIGSRASTDYQGAATRVSRDDADAVLVLATEAIATLLPGVVVDGVTAVDVEHVLDGGKLRTTIWGGASEGDRALEAMRAIVQRLTANLRYRGVWEYRVVKANGDRWDLQIVRKSTGMPDLRRVKARPGVAGCKATLALGSLVLVSFVDGSPSRPVIVGFDDAESPGFSPTELAIEAGTTGAAPTEHATSAEATVNLIVSTLVGLATTYPGPWIGASIAASTPVVMNATLAAASTASIAPYATALNAALAAKTPNTTGLIPNVGWPDVRGG